MKDLHRTELRNKHRKPLRELEQEVGHLDNPLAQEHVQMMRESLAIMTDTHISKRTVVRVSKTAALPPGQVHLRDRLGMVDQDSQPGTDALVDFREGKIEKLRRDVLTLVLDAQDAAWTFHKACNLVTWSNPATRSKRTKAVKLAMHSELTEAKEEEILRVYKELSDKRRGRKFNTLRDYLSRGSVEKEVAAICGVKRTTVTNLRFRKGCCVRRRQPVMSPSKQRAYLREIKDLVPHLSDADLVKMLKDNGLLGTMLLKCSGGIAEVLRYIRGGQLPDVNAPDSAVDEGIKETDYASPEVPIDIHAADRAARQQITEETVRHIVESQLASLRAKWFQDGNATEALALIRG